MYRGGKESRNTWGQLGKKNAKEKKKSRQLPRRGREAVGAGGSWSWPLLGEVRGGLRAARTAPCRPVLLLLAWLLLCVLPKKIISPSSSSSIVRCGTAGSVLADASGLQRRLRRSGWSWVLVTRHAIIGSLAHGNWPSGR